jgi:hypothetical protein
MRDTMFDALGRDPFAGYTRRKTKALPVQEHQLPYLGVYIVDDVMGPDGDANTGSQPIPRCGWVASVWWRWARRAGQRN